jgi:uncharacterized protein (UPF0335 family)
VAPIFWHSIGPTHRAGEHRPSRPKPTREEQPKMIGRNTTAGDKLTAYAQRIEHLLDEIDALRADLKEVKAEAKHDGFNVQAKHYGVMIKKSTIL